MKKFLLLIIFLFFKIKSEEEYNEYKPVIGIYGNSNPQNDCKYVNQTFIAGSNVRFLESYGAETMAIHQWYSDQELEEILSKINGVLFIGGGRDFNLSCQWEKQAKHIIKRAKETGLPIWGTCQGFQLIIALIAEDAGIIKKEYSHDFTVDKLNESSFNNDSLIFSLFENKSLDVLFNNKSILFDHNFGLSRNDYDNNKALKNELTITSYANDNKGKEFANTFESKNKNIFGSQFHPETMPYIRRENSKFKNEDNVLRMNVLIGNFIVDLCRKNKNRFNKEDRGKYDFINLYENNTNYWKYDNDSNGYYFAKKKENDRINPFIIIIFIIGGIFILFILVVVVFRLRNKKKEDYYTSGSPLVEN